MNFIFNPNCLVCGKHRASNDHRECAKVNQKQHANDIRKPSRPKKLQKNTVAYLETVEKLAHAYE